MQNPFLSIGDYLRGIKESTLFSSARDSIDPSLEKIGPVFILMLLKYAVVLPVRTIV